MALKCAMRAGLVIAASLLGEAVVGAAVASPSLDVAAADNEFGFRLLNAVQKTKPGSNVVLSPLSAALNLSMVLNGAEGETREEMLTALSLRESQLDEINAANAALMKTLRTPGRDITLAVADSLWADSRRAKLRPDYVSRMRAAYDAELSDLDFADPSAARRINDWSSKATDGKIPQVVGRIDPVELVLLLSAVYFKGQWTHKFDKTKTQEHDFTLNNGDIRQVPRMAQSGRFDYFETTQVQAIRLPFGTGDLVMEVLLPAKSTDLAALEMQLTPEHWRDWQARYTSRPGTLELPRFELKSRYSLIVPLEALGIRRAFKPGGAQLTAMLSSGASQSALGHAFISSVVQSTYWRVDEEGSEAAAVTTTGVRASAVARPQQPFEMIVDRPFFCAIQDQRSGALLFVGAIYDPAA